MTVYDHIFFGMIRFNHLTLSPRIPLTNQMTVIVVAGFQDEVLPLLTDIPARNFAFQLVGGDFDSFPLIRFFFAHNGINIVLCKFSRSIRFVHTDGLSVTADRTSYGYMIRRGSIQRPLRAYLCASCVHSFQPSKHPGFFRHRICCVQARFSRAHGRPRLRSHVSGGDYRSCFENGCRL